MTNEEKRTQIEQTVAEFAAAYWQQLCWQAGQFVLGMDGKMGRHDITHQNVLQRTMEPQEWLTMALYGAGLIDADPGYIYEICQGMAEWLFSVPNYSAYSIPDFWADVPTGALWWAAFIRVQGDELITIAEAAELAGVSVQAISQRIDQGRLDAFIDPTAPARQGRRLVKRSDVS